jgi:receptor protein-tyrosine kinase
MSRIQHILDKAEREGHVRRVRGLDAPTSPGGTPTPAWFDPLPDQREVGHETPAGGVLLPGRLVAGAHLDPHLLTARPADEAAAEQYRALRTRMLHADGGASARVILITSPGAQEGKTLTVGNLGLAMAQEQTRRICLIDADLRTPQLQRLFGLPDGPGLCDVLSGGATLADALVTLEEHRLTILPAGDVPPRAPELLGTAAMRGLIDTLRAEFDRTLIDATAAAPLADVDILTPLVDALLLVVRAGVTSKPAIGNALASLDRSKLLGLVLNESS